jgi:acyl-CoA dehydrogenase
MEQLDEGRLSVACTCLGAADRLLELSSDYACQRRTFGAPLASRQSIQWMIADSATEIASARALIYETLRQAEAGVKLQAGASMCKLLASEMAGRVADRAVQIHGGNGVVRGGPVERLYRDLRIFRIGEGASEVQRMVIARSVLQ